MRAPGLFLLPACEYHPSGAKREAGSSAGMDGSSDATGADACGFCLCDRAAVYAFEGDAASLCETHQPINPGEALTKVGDCCQMYSSGMAGVLL